MGEGPDFPKNTFFIYLFNQNCTKTLNLFDLKTTIYLILHHIEARTDNCRLSGTISSSFKIYKAFQKMFNDKWTDFPELFNLFVCGSTGNSKDAFC